MFEKFLMALMFETQGLVFKGVSDLIQKYKNDGLDVVPISELENVYHEATKKSLHEDSLVNTLMKEEK